MKKNISANKIVSIFHEFGYQPHFTLNRHETFKLLNDIAEANSSIGQIKTPILQQIWEYANKKDNTITINDLSIVIAQAIKSLQEQYQDVQKQIRATNSEGQRRQLLLQLYSVSQDHQMLALPFKIKQMIETDLLYESMKLIPETLKNKEKYIFSFELTEETIGLKIILWMAMLLLGIEVIMMFHKQHFYSLLCLCMVLSIFMLNYFDAAFIKFLIGNLFFSTFLDIIWEISNAKRYWDKDGDDFICFQHSNILKFSTIFILMVAVGKLVIAGILFKYRNNPANLCINFEFLELRFSLDADPRNNPITRLF